MPSNDRGSGVLLAIVVASTMLALGLGLVAISSTERAIAANHQAGTEALYAADALAGYVLTELSSDSSWGPALTGERHSAFLEPTAYPVAPWNEALDLLAMTTRLQTQSNAVWSAGLDTPRWQLFAAGPFAALAESGLAASIFLVAWVADDAADVDDDPGVDSNGTLMVRAQALGVGGIQRSLHIVIRRDAGSSDPDAPRPPGVRMVSWREVR